MNKNFSLLYDSDEINRFFKDILVLDIYDYNTMEKYVEKNVGKLSVKELKIILKTITEEKDNLNSIRIFLLLRSLLY
ncbi:hypothetical protein ACOMCU_12330 [Lysinibacillus sp. UGB7]|uniref:hypothetical protein n=1 Tax=Lysinibacillus sp. UGB7 TaxID=3411039 RepID=UPI003B811325